MYSPVQASQGDELGIGGRIIPTQSDRKRLRTLAGCDSCRRQALRLNTASWPISAVRRMFGLWSSRPSPSHAILLDTMSPMPRHPHEALAGRILVDQVVNDRRTGCGDDTNDGQQPG
jgi:hypothetical protein